MNITFKLFGHVITIKRIDNPIVICYICNHQGLYHGLDGCSFCNCKLTGKDLYR